MRIYTIYKTTNDINGKCYIGFDSEWPNRRIAHNSQAHRESSNAYHSYFHNAIRKYGRESFGWEILYQSTDKFHTLRVMEPHFIKEYNSYGKDGYNLTYGGDGRLGGFGSLGLRHSEESKQRIAQGNAKNWKVTSPIGVVLSVTNLHQFCKLHDLKMSSMSDVARGFNKHHKGWVCKLESVG